MIQQYVHMFSDGDRDQTDLLGGNGANLAEMVKLGLPVPPAFTITTEACRAYLGEGRVPPEVRVEVTQRLRDVEDLIAAAGLPPIYIYDRNVSVAGVSTKVVADDKVMLLPEPVDTNDWQGTELGATFWGQTLTSTEADWSIDDAEQPGLVAGVYRNEKPPMVAEVISDAIALPVLANANLSFTADVL